MPRYTPYTPIYRLPRGDDRLPQLCCRRVMAAVYTLSATLAANSAVALASIFDDGEDAALGESPAGDSAIAGPRACANLKFLPSSISLRNARLILR